MESRTLAGAKKSLDTAIKVADSRREIENGKEYPIYLSILGTGKNEGSFQSFQGSVSFQDGVGRVSSNLYKQLGMGASLKVNGDSIELSGKDTDGFSVVANADGISILGRDKEEELDQGAPQSAPSKKEDLKHSGAREAKNLMEKQNSAKMRKQRQDLVAESNRLLDQDFQNTVRGMNRMFRMLMFLEQMNSKAAGTLAQANSLRYAEKSHSMAQINNTHDQVHDVINRLKDLEKETQLALEMNVLQKPSEQINKETNPNFFYTLPLHEQCKVVDAFKEISSYIAVANGVDEKIVAETLFGGLNIDIYDPIFKSKKPTQYVTISSRPSKKIVPEEINKSGVEKNDDNTSTPVREAKVNSSSTRQDSIDLSAYSTEQITAFIDKYYPKQCPAGTPDGQKKINKSVRKFFEGLLFSENLMGQNVSNLNLLEGQVVREDKNKGCYILGSIGKNGKFIYSGDLHVGPDGTIEAFELPDGSNRKHQQAKLEAIDKLREEYPEVEQSRISYEVPAPDSDSKAPAPVMQSFPFTTEGVYNPEDTATYTLSFNEYKIHDYISGIATTAETSNSTKTGPLDPSIRTNTETANASLSNDDSSNKNQNYKDRVDHYSEMIENSMSPVNNFHGKIDLSALLDRPEVAPVEVFVDKKLGKAQDEVEAMCQKLAELPDKQLAERTSMEETFTERTMKIVIYELKLSRTELKQQLTEEAGILSKDKSLTPTRRKQLLALKQDEIKKKQQKRLYERIMKQKIEQRQQLSKLLIKQSKERANLAEVVESKLDYYNNLANNIEQRKANVIDNMSKHALSHLYKDLDNAKQLCDRLYTQFMESGNTQGLKVIRGLRNDIEVLQTSSTQNRYNPNSFSTADSASIDNSNDGILDTYIEGTAEYGDNPRQKDGRITNNNGEPETGSQTGKVKKKGFQNPGLHYLNLKSFVQALVKDNPHLARTVNGMNEKETEITTQIFYDLRNPNVVAASNDRLSYPISGINPEQTKPGNNGPTNI